MSEIITYEVLYEILRKEKYLQELQNVDKNFYRNALKYLQEKQKLVDAESSRDSIFASELKKVQKELENIKRMLKEIYEKRENKILTLALFASRSGTREDGSAMLPEERMFYKEIVQNLDAYRNGLLMNLLSLRMPQLAEVAPQTIKTSDKLPEEVEDKKLIRIVHPIPQFLGPDFTVYGPFDQGEMCYISRKIADVLVSKNRAEEIHVEVH